MSKNNRRPAFASVVFVVLALSASTATAAEDLPLTFTALATAMGVTLPPITPRGGATVQIDISRWSTEEERNALYTALSQSGQGKLFDDLQRQAETGTFRITGIHGGRLRTVPLRYAREYGYGDKRRIVLATDLPINFYERRGRPRFRDYDVSIIVLDIDENGQGEGEVGVGVRLELDEENNRLAVQSFASEPVWLKSVRQQ